MTLKLATLHTVQDLRNKIKIWRQNGERICLVPTMGALHEGHLSLVKFARKKADRVIVSIFVNPKQFGPNEDFSSYPRKERADQEKLESVKTDLLFLPKVEEIYPEGFATTVSVSGLTDVLCGASRPGHFSGVATIVTKLLMQAMPDIAVFGEKDYQQLLVIKRFVRDLDIPVKITGAPIVREEDGLAMSSRNAYLSKEERVLAPKLYEILKTLSAGLKNNVSLEKSLETAKNALLAYGFKIDYLQVRNAKTLELISEPSDQPARIFAAVFLGKTRLIDNLAIASD